MYLNLFNSWFCVVRSEDLFIKGVILFYYFGKDFVLFCIEDGKFYIFDVYCFYLGVYFVYGGRIEG